jgi:hypothetical protein
MIDPNGNKGVSRAPLPTHPWTCNLCRDSGMHRHTGEVNFCGCPAGVALKLKEPGAAALCQATLAKPERISK